MDDRRKLLIGMDLGSEITQMSCFDFTTYEPNPIGRMVRDKREYEIPTALALDPARGEWYWIDEAKAQEEGMVQLKHLLADVIREDTIMMGSLKLDSYQVLRRYMVKVLSLLKEYYPNDTIRKMVITVEKREKKLVEYLTRICEELGMPENGLRVQNYRQSYMYYAISQPKELWCNNVGLFELGDNGLWYSQIDINRKTEPYIIGVTQKDLTEDMDWNALKEEGDANISYAFLNAAQTVLHKQYVTTLYVTGKGFDGEWANDALKELCMGRRIFRGQNLFTKGACFAARELSGEGKLNHCLFLDEEMVASNVYLRTYKDAEDHEELLVRAGTIWSEVDGSVDVIPDDEEEIQIIVQDVLKHETRAHMLSLSGFSNRENKTTRFTIRIRFADRTTCIVTLKDNGFGEICPASNRVWERHIQL